MDTGMISDMMPLKIATTLENKKTHGNTVEIFTIQNKK